MTKIVTYFTMSETVDLAEVKKKKKKKKSQNFKF